MKNYQKRNFEFSSKIYDAKSSSPSDPWSFEMMMRHVLFWSILPTSFSAPSSSALVTVNLNEEQATLHYRRKKIKSSSRQSTERFCSNSVFSTLIYKFANVKIATDYDYKICSSLTLKKASLPACYKFVSKVENTDVVFELVQVNDNGKLCNLSREGWWKRRTL